MGLNIITVGYRSLVPVDSVSAKKNTGLCPNHYWEGHLNSSFGDKHPRILIKIAIFTT